MAEVSGKTPHPFVDYRRLNSITKDQIYLIPNIEERIEIVKSAKFISKLDLLRGYGQVPLTNRASRYSAFVSPFGTFHRLNVKFRIFLKMRYFTSLV